MRQSPFVSLLALAGGFAIVPPALIHFVGGDKVHFSSTVHFWAVGLSASIAIAAGIALSVGGKRRGDARAVLVGTAFTVMSGLLVVHGFASPGVVVDRNGVVALTGAATLPVGGAILALSVLPAIRERRSVVPLLWLQGVLMAGVLSLGALALLVPSLVPSVPEPASGPALATLVAGLVFFSWLGLRALRTALLTQRRADLLVVVGIVWLAAALVPALTMNYSDLGWWLGHGFEVAGILIVGAPVALDLFRASPSRPLAGDLSGAELVAAEEAYLGSHVRAFTRLLADKDAYTEDHTRRVALLAVGVGEELGLPPARLRELAIGGLLHDVGKLSVPDAILKKPGALDDDEFAVVRKHPGWGDTLLGELSFPRGVRRLVRNHHERLDGSGYPHGLHGESLCLPTRILAVCDVYDALRSQRVYRDAWSHEQALGLLRGQAGGAFDARCVAALERVLASAGGFVPVPAVAFAV